MQCLPQEQAFRDLDIVDEICFRCFEFGHPVLHPLGDEFLGIDWIYLYAISRY